MSATIDQTERLQRITGRTRIAAVLGDPVEHSMSPVLHNAAFVDMKVDGVFIALTVRDSDLGSVVKTLADVDAIGASVTVPHKISVIEHCARLAPSAQAVGAVNCLSFETDGVVGHNTDAAGFAASVQESFPNRSLRPLLFGGGGAARAVAVGLAEAGHADAVVIARHPERVSWIKARPWTAEVVDGELAQRDLVIDCTSAGLSESSERMLPSPIDVGRCAKNTIVSSLVYHRQTKLLADARKRGLETLDGLGMLIHQALGALEIWIGTAPPPEILWRAARAKARARQPRES